MELTNREKRVLENLRNYGTYIRNSRYIVIATENTYVGREFTQKIRIIHNDPEDGLIAFKSVREDQKSWEEPVWVHLPKRMAQLMALACFPEEAIWG